MLSIDVSFVSKFFWKGDKNFKNLTNGQMHMEDPVQTTSYFSFNFHDRSFMQWLGHPPKIFLVLSSNSESNISFKNFLYQLQHFSKEYSLITNSNFGAYVCRNWVEEGIKKKRQQINFVITYLLYSLHQMQLIFPE